MHNTFARLPTLKTVEAFQRYCSERKIDLPCDSQVITGPSSPLAQPISAPLINGKSFGNRFAVQPMEGWDGSPSGGATPEVRRRWQRFGESGAKLVWGGEAMAVRPEGRANPRQIVIGPSTEKDLSELRALLECSHRERFGTAGDLVVGFQLTHSGRFCRPHEPFRLEPRLAYRHPILDSKFSLGPDAPVLSDEALDTLVSDFVQAAQVAWNAGADFVDIKHCHGYLLHEFLSAHTRPGNYGGSFANRTRLLREIVAGIRGRGNRIELGVRLSAFDSVPFHPDPALSRPGHPGPGIPERFDHCLPYRYAFGANPEAPLEYDLTEPLRFLELCASLGVKLVNLSAGSPYYNPHLQRPAAYPPSDGYQPPEDPLLGVARQLQVVRQLKARAPRDLIVVGSGYSYLQEFLPHVAQAVVRQGWTDVVGLGRLMLSYPGAAADILDRGEMDRKKVCRTFSDCTTAPRNGMISGCYPLDAFYKQRPEAGRLKAVKERADRR